MGRYNQKIKIGDSFGKLTVIAKEKSYVWVSPIGKTSHKAQWKCVCECGMFTVHLTHYLLTNKNPQCSVCAYKSRPQSTRRFSDTERLFNMHLTQVKRRGIENKLTVKEFESLIKQDCFYCGVPPKPRNYRKKNKVVAQMSITTNGIDRVNSNLGYEVTNCVPCCRLCNSAKGSLSQKDFYELIGAIYHNRICLNG